MARKMSVVRAPSGELAPREGIAYANKAKFYMCNLTLVLGSLYREYSILEQIGGRMYLVDKRISSDLKIHAIKINNIWT